MIKNTDPDRGNSTDVQNTAQLKCALKSKFDNEEADDAAVPVVKAEDVVPEFSVSQAAAQSPLELEDAMKALQKKHNLSKGDLTAEWESMQQLTNFCKTAKIIAAEVRKSMNIRLVKGRKRKHNIMDQDAYNQGREDSKKINVRIKTVGE